ncbi:MAG: thiosulfate oxidation carrier complex protein SoxZ, partial [Burkholderiaceae bacterium]|nr:thiosulfate oxidation carrier complex protein SoxZ [Burkholderiaceae bacterium]
MTEPTRIRATAQPDGVEVRLLMTHEMETGQRKDAAGKPIPAHFITNVTVRHAGRVVFSGEFGPGVSKNPFLLFKFAGGKKGDELEVTWVDNKGQTRT